MIAAKGEDVDKEIYVLERLQADPDEKKDARLALHFDQTVPLARYVAQHFSELTFPFKRYQMQKVWRGERPQMGRMREFYQCDIDVIHQDNLPIHFDAEVASVIYEALSSIDIGRVQLRVSNRKILLGLLEGLEISDPVPVTRIIDKLEKIGEDDVRAELSKLKLPDTHINDILKLSSLRKQGPTSLRDEIPAFAGMTDMMREGIEELQFVLDNLSHLPEGSVVADLSIVRGLDYYTGTVYETALLDVPEFTGSVCSGGRYDDLAGNYINRHLPGVGISIGFTRLFDVLRQAGKIQPGPKSPAHVLVVLPSEDERAFAADTARTLRENGMNVELFHAPQNIGKQIAYAEKKDIPYVWFPFSDGHKVKDLSSGEQIDADPKTWTFK